MNDVHFKYEEADQFYLKDEPECDDTPGNTSSCRAQSDKIVFHETRETCGMVFVGCQGDFTLVCSVCKDEFETFDQFGSHIKRRHLGLQLEPDEPLEHIFTESLPIWDDSNTPRLSSRENTKNASDTENYSRMQPVPLASTSQETTNILQPNQCGENTAAKQANDISEKGEELDEESSGDEYTPEDEADSKNQSPKVKNDYFCLFCGRSYTRKTYFVAHSKQKHNYNPAKKAIDSDASVKPLTELVKMVCKYCEKSFDDQIEFKNHMRTHTGAKRFECRFCQKKFNCRSFRDAHVNTHTGERPFKCTRCPKAFADSNTLLQHTRMHLKIKKFSCDYCGKRFVQSAVKLLHERTHTGEKPYQCEECGRRFIARAQLNEHLKRHKDIKNYKCEVCNKAFYTSTLLKYHIRTHTGGGRFNCTISSQTFS